eukprot:1137475-Pelagomonas_calceolata.AAC.1
MAHWWSRPLDASSPSCLNWLSVCSVLHVPPTPKRMKERGEKRKEEPTPTKRQRALRKGSLTSKLARSCQRALRPEVLRLVDKASLGESQKQSQGQGKTEIRRVIGHALGCPDSPSPVLHSHVPSIPSIPPDPPRYRQQKDWREADALSPQEANRKAATYHCWCGKSLNQTARTSFCIPSYLFRDMDKEVMRNMSRFRLRAHGLKVESYKWLGGSNVCDECESAEVQDETPALFYCNCFEARELRRKYKDLFVDLFKPLHTFARLPIMIRLYSFLGKLSHYN